MSPHRFFNRYFCTIVTCKGKRSIAVFKWQEAFDLIQTLQNAIYMTCETFTNSKCCQMTFKCCQMLSGTYISCNILPFDIIGHLPKHFGKTSVIIGISYSSKSSIHAFILTHLTFSIGSTLIVIESPKMFLNN